MKKIPALIGILMIFSISYAQDYKWELGVLGGINQTHYTNKPYNDWAFRLGPTVGLSVKYNWKEHFSVYTNIIYQQGHLVEQYIDHSCGGKLSGLCYGSLERRITNQYLTMPVMTRWSYGQKLKLFVDAGVQMSYLFNQKESYEELSSVSDGPLIEPMKYYEWDIAFSSGIGSTYSISKRLNVSLEGRLTGLYFREFNDPDRLNWQVLTGLSYSL
ncbi:PorT family protein [bacterium SCSIO 12643]|nr:PorT family protein [bacterium SCSIO 12643]